MNFLSRLTLCLALLSQVLLGTGRGMVLCVESDGSVNIEISTVSCCEPEAVHDRQGDGEREECSSEEDGCGDCTDQAFQFLEGPRGKHALPPLLAIPVGLVGVLRPSDRVSPLRVPGELPLDPRLVRLRSVVLRC